MGPAWLRGPSFSSGRARSCGVEAGTKAGHGAYNIAYPRKHSIVANENYENYRSTSGNGTIGIYHNNNNLTISKLSIDSIMIISPAMLLSCYWQKRPGKLNKMNQV